MRFAVRSEDIQNIVWISERESGEMPERSGHCIQGMRLRRFHCLPHRARRRSRVSICKSGNLLGMWEALPVERNTPNWHRQPVISDMGSRNGIDLKECCLEGNEYTQIYLLEFRFSVLQHWKFLNLVQRDIPQAICTIILHSFWLYSAMQSGAVFLFKYFEDGRYLFDQVSFLFFWKLYDMFYGLSDRESRKWYSSVYFDKWEKDTWILQTVMLRHYKKYTYRSFERTKKYRKMIVK